MIKTKISIILFIFCLLTLNGLAFAADSDTKELDETTSETAPTTSEETEDEKILKAKTGTVEKQEEADTSSTEPEEADDDEEEEDDGDEEPDCD